MEKWSPFLVTIFFVRYQARGLTWLSDTGVLLGKTSLYPGRVVVLFINAAGKPVTSVMG